MLSNLLLYRFVIFNTLMFALVAALAWNGALAPIYQNDQSGLTSAPDGSEGEFMMSYEPSTNMSEQQFHAVPPEPALPPKDAPQPALVYEQG